MALGGSFTVTEFRYLPFSGGTRCRDYEVYVAATNNGDWGPAVAAGTWGNDTAEKTASLAVPKEGAFVRIRYLNIAYCFAAEHNVVGAAIVAANVPPTITSTGGGPTAGLSVPENQTAVTTVTATDPDLSPGPLVYSLSGGADQIFFIINGSSGLLSFASPPDFENPIDNNGDNIYDVIVQVADGPGGQDTQAIAVRVTDDAGDSGGGGLTEHDTMIKAAITAAQTAIQGTVQTERTGVQTELTAQNAMLKTEQEDTQTVLAEVKALVEGLTSAAPAPACPAGGTADTSGRYVTYAASGLDPIHVCDRNSGLFWEQSPDGVNRYTLDPGTAQAHCAALGPDWRVPEIRELVGLVDTTFSNPTANTSVFSNVKSGGYWSATTLASNPTGAWFVLFLNGRVSTNLKTNISFVWCVRSDS